MIPTPGEEIASAPPVWLWPTFLHECARDYSRFCSSVAASADPVTLIQSEGDFGLRIWRDALHAYADAVDGLSDALWPGRRAIAGAVPRTSPLTPLPD